MISSAYRLKNPITVVLLRQEHYRLMELPAGSVFYAAHPEPDPNGMIDGTCKGDVVMMFSCDLEARAEPIVEETSPA